MNTITKVMRYEIINIENEDKKTMKKYYEIYNMNQEN